MTTRPPIVVILGHVDHGKTSLLDALLKTSIATGEAGGITQSVRAFQLVSDKQTITFVDTPGHEAFSQMRSRGGRLADIALLIIAGTDGVMPQTKESIAIITAAGIPFIVVVTKSDLPEFNLDKIKNQLAENGVLVEGFGGDVPIVTVSAKSGVGMPELIELISLVNELQPTQADDQAPFSAVVLESSLDVQKGAVAVVVVKNGTMSIGQPLYLGTKLVGKVKALTATSGVKLQTAPPSTPAQVLGLTEVPMAGSALTPAPYEDSAAVVESATTKGTGLRVILKADVAGSLEVMLNTLPADLSIIASGVGEINESDVLLSQSTGAVIVGFNTKVSASAAKLAEIEKVKIVTTNIIYELLATVDLLAHPKATETVTGQAQVLAEFKIDAWHVAGCRCTEGEVNRGDIIRLGTTEARVKSLRLAKTEVAKVKKDQEFGAIFSPPIDFKVGDTIIAVTKHG